MHRRTPNTLARALLGCAWGLWSCAQAQAPTPTPVAGPTLAQAFEAAWARQPEAAALAARRSAARAQQQAASAWTPEPPALEVAGKTDRLGRNGGSRELEVGVAVPLWLPGERSSSGALADAESRAVESRARAAQWRLAGQVRSGWWAWQRAHIDAASARAQQASATQTAADVARRQQAGELARADQHQADGAVATADAALAQAEAAVVAAQSALRAATGLTFSAAPAVVQPEPEPEPSAATPDIDSHAALLELQDHSAVAQGTAALARAQNRANPELTLAATRERGAYGEPYGQAVTLGLRFPFGAGPRQGARVASAQADATEVQSQLALERERLLGERDSVRAALAAARTQVAAAARRAQLATETRGFFDKSFKLGETDLPTRLRIEAEAAEAQREAARARVRLAEAVSSWRQALGLLPE